ncbi:MAG: RNA polymerase sigma factor [bacterium]
MSSASDDDVRRLLDRRAYRGAFDLLLERYWNKMYHLAYSFVRERGAAEDLAQETFLKLWRALPEYSGEAALSTWIYVIGRNTCLSELRKQSHRKALPLEDPAVQAAADRARHQRAKGTERLECESLLALLSEEQRRVVALYYLEGRSCEEVAAMLGIASGTVRSQLHRARRRFAALSAKATPQAGAAAPASSQEVAK